MVQYIWELRNIQDNSIVNDFYSYKKVKDELLFFGKNNVYIKRIIKHNKNKNKNKNNKNNKKVIKVIINNKNFKNKKNIKKNFESKKVICKGCGVETGTKIFKDGCCDEICINRYKKRIERFENDDCLLIIENNEFLVL